MTTQVDCPHCNTTFDPTVSEGRCPNEDCAFRQPHSAAPGPQQADTSPESAQATEPPAPKTSTGAQPPAHRCPNPACRAPVNARWEFCFDCGASLPSTTPPSQQDETEPNSVATSVESETEPAATPAAADQEPTNATSTEPRISLEGLDEQLVVRPSEPVGAEIRTAMVAAGRPHEEARYVHRDHVAFTIKAGKLSLVDHGVNATRLNGEPLQKGDERPVSDGDTLALADVVDLTIRLT